MKLRALDSMMVTGAGMLKRGDIFEVSDHIGRDLIRNRQADELVHRPNPNRPPANKIVAPPETKAPGQSDDPLSRSGSQTGTEQPLSSSPVDPLQKPQRLKQPKTKRGSYRSTKGGA